MLDTGLSFFRYLVPAQEISENAEIQPLFENQDDEICFFNHFAAGTSIVTYLCEGRKTRAINVFARRMPNKSEMKAGKQISTISQPDSV